MNKKRKIIVILGTTSSGKSELAVSLAKKFDGEIVSADSRQVYRGLNIGSGKVPRDQISDKLDANCYLYKGIPHHLLDVENPKNVFSVSDYKKLGEKALDDIWNRGKIPIVCGGTGLYIQALVDGLLFPKVPPNKKLRQQLENKSSLELFSILKKLDPRRAKEIDSKNPRRVIRAIEIAKYLGSIPHLAVRPPSGSEVLKIGITIPDKTLKKNIHLRLLKRAKEGMVAEAIRLHKQGLSWKRMEELGLEYRYVAQFLQNKISKKEMMNKIEQESWRYAKRQCTWFKRDKRIMWFKPQQKKNIEKLARRFL